RERLVELDEVYLARVDSGSGQELANSRNGSDAHESRVDAGYGASREPAERLPAQLCRLLLARDHERGRTVVDPARVPGRDRAPVAEGRAQRRELLRIRVGPRVLVALHPVHGDELVREAAGLLRRRPALLRAEREGVLLLARAAVPLAHVL